MTVMSSTTSSALATPQRESLLTQLPDCVVVLDANSYCYMYTFCIYLKVLSVVLCTHKTSLIIFLNVASMHVQALPLHW